MVDSDDEGDDTDDGVLGTPGAHGGVAPGGRERLRAADKTRHRPCVRVRVRRRRPKARGSCKDVSFVVHSRQETVQPATGSPQPTVPPSPQQGQGRGNWSPPQSAYRKCGKLISKHIPDAAVVTAVKASVDHRCAESLLRMWWADWHRWALARPKVSPEDEAFLHDTLHHLASRPRRLEHHISNPTHPQ